MFNINAAPAPTPLPLSFCPFLGNSLHIPQVQLPDFISPRDSLARQPEFNHLNPPASCPPTSTCTRWLMPTLPPVVKCKIFLLRLDGYKGDTPKASSTPDVSPLVVRSCWGLMEAATLSPFLTRGCLLGACLGSHVFDFGVPSRELQ